MQCLWLSWQYRWKHRNQEMLLRCIYTGHTYRVGARFPAVFKRDERMEIMTGGRVQASPRNKSNNIVFEALGRKIVENESR